MTTNIMLSILKLLKIHFGILNKAVYIGNNMVLINNAFNFRMIVDSQDISVSSNLIIDGAYERNITRVFKNIIKEGMNVLEIGANIGWYSLLAAAKVGKKGRCFIFEANPHIFDYLYRNILINDFIERVELVNKAVYNKSGKLNFHIPKYISGNSSVREIKNKANFADGVGCVERIEVPCVSIDEYFKGQQIKIDVIKIDAEGSEPFIFEGMEEIISANPDIKIICEFAPHFISEIGRNPHEFIKSIKNIFPLRHIDSSGKIKHILPSELIENNYTELYLSRK